MSVLTENLPDPPTPAECDLRGMPYMPLDLVRLFDSDFYALSTGEEFKAGFTLWGKAFLQVPAGSLPDDDRILSHLSGANSKRWPKVKKMVMRGWYLCSDGRLYHATVAEKVGEAWQARLDRRARTEAARAARRTPPNPPPNGHDRSDATFDVTISATSSVTDNATSNAPNSQLRELPVIHSEVNEFPNRYVNSAMFADDDEPIEIVEPTPSVTEPVAETVTGSKGTERKGGEDKKERDSKSSLSFRKNAREAPERKSAEVVMLHPPPSRPKPVEPVRTVEEQLAQLPPPTTAPPREFTVEQLQARKPQTGDPLKARRDEIDRRMREARQKAVPQPPPVEPVATEPTEQTEKPPLYPDYSKLKAQS